MDKKDLESKKLSDLRVIAAAAGIENADTYKKAELINQLTGKASEPVAVAEPVAEASSETSDDKPKRKRTRVEKVEIGKKQPSLFSEEKPAIVAETPEVKEIVETKVPEITETAVEDKQPASPAKKPQGPKNRPERPGRNLLEIIKTPTEKAEPVEGEATEAAAVEGEVVAPVQEKESVLRKIAIQIRTQTAIKETIRIKIITIQINKIVVLNTKTNQLKTKHQTTRMI